MVFVATDVVVVVSEFCFWCLGFVVISYDHILSIYFINIFRVTLKVATKPEGTELS